MALSKKYNLFNRDFICLFAINFIATFAFYMTTITSNDYAVKILNADTAMAGLASGIFVIGALFARLYFGSKIDNINIKLLIYVGIILYLIDTLFYFIVKDIYVLIVIRFVAGLCYGICSSACGALIARIIPKNKRGVGIGYYALSVIFSSAIGPFLAVLLSSKNAFNLSFLITAISIFLALIFNIILKVRKLKISHQKQKAKGLFAYIEKSSLGISSVVFILGICYGAILIFMSAYTQALDTINNNYIFKFSQAGAVFFICYAIVSVFSRPIAGKLFDKYGANFVILPSLVCFVFCLLLLANAFHPSLILLSAIFCALGYGVATSSAQSLAIKLAPVNKVGLASTTFFIALDLGIGLSPYCLGKLEPILGYANLFNICAVLVVFSVFLYYLFVMKKNNP